jgi:Na+/proline symporter
MTGAGYFGTADYILMGIYVTVLVGLGMYLKGKASESIEDYFIGGRKMPWWLLGISGTAQFVDIAGTALIISLLYIMGPKALFVEIRGGICIHMAVVMLWTGKWHRRSGCITGAEWSVFRFGSGPSGQASRIVTAIAVPIFIIGMVTYLSVAVGLFFSMFLPLSPMWCSMGG